MSYVLDPPPRPDPTTPGFDRANFFSRAAHAHERTRVNSDNRYIKFLAHQMDNAASYSDPRFSGVTPKCKVWRGAVFTIGDRAHANNSTTATIQENRYITFVRLTRVCPLPKF